jgi:uracil-DNA glycosylase family 4
MPSELTNELASLIARTREELTYFHELGIENIERGSLAAASPTSSVTETFEQPGFKKAPISASPSADQFPSHVSAVPILDQVRENQHPVDTVAASPSLFGELAAPVEASARSSETFEDIRADIGNCTRCPLYERRTTIVHTDGNERARLMFVGEAPGADEDAQGRPFVGRAGQLLTKIIEAIGFKRDEVLIGNVNRCRPPANRPPTTEEAAMCKPFLLREIAAVRPEVIVVLGNTAMRNLLDTKVGITKLRGQFQDYQGAKVMPTFHPAYLLRDPSKKKETWADLQKVRDYLAATRRRPD